MEELRSLDLLATRAHLAPRPIQWEDVSKLTYLNNVIKARARGKSSACASASSASCSVHCMEYLAPDSSSAGGLS